MFQVQTSWGQGGHLGGRDKGTPFGDGKTIWGKEGGNTGPDTGMMKALERNG